MSNTLDPRALTWVKSTYSDAEGGQCIEWSPSYAHAHGVVPVRDSKTPSGSPLMLTLESFTSLVRSLKA
ncbi:DUF397 domain-containing protein [Streptomyces acidiscabies]|uniref:DUF397 domain-containing protein n=1 Tax=Streptomyces acidiscabies TaxID=42234 RepID=A0AAP6BGD8_9ACTN|nr:DUF397 domain-containing protein [Streptomyces acidiscabies]MBP5937505.1 DUF397 domain-containing protein [Streptomyces sp. LBUM 1476]MBZ3914407.1 DUF397 domain-containing protein [Streptomyces acidiscabies]MDX2964275.1 DUF397 domain-containing protein [Streptomyces acidiscabies]MDX3017096.1 DUF397 domain-containing protein [Streptomyces acidiscabies]MDX3789047.1 DUF397 domain-containing protein [Streptomyces acidiscabies]